jgi:ATP-dependent Clp protease protease subunit
MSEMHDPLAGVLRSQRFRDYQRQRQYGTGDILLDNRIVFLGISGSTFAGTEINDLTATMAIQQMLYLQYENRNQEIHFYINSPGGSVTSTLAIYDTMQFLECPVVTYCMGLAASGAAILLAAGAKGKRYALPNSRIMIHQGSGGFRGNAPDAVIQMKEWEFLVERNIEIMARHTGQTVEQVRQDTDRDRFMSPDAAKDYGIIDAVYSEQWDSLTAQHHDEKVAEVAAESGDAPEPKRSKSE